MRSSIFAICTLLSSFAFFAAFSLHPALPSCELNHRADCLDHDQRLAMGTGYLLYLAMLMAALIAYFRMGIAWVQKKRLGFSWPIVGTMAAASTLSGVGLGIPDGFSAHLKWVEVGMIAASPAIALAIWMVIFHARRARSLPGQRVT